MSGYEFLVLALQFFFCLVLYVLFAATCSGLMRAGRRAVDRRRRRRS